MDLINELEDIKIDIEFKNLLPKLTSEQYAELEKSIIKDGCRDPLVKWKGFLIDGHNRRSICMQNKIPAKVIEIDFETKADAILWVMKNQTSRRNLSAYDRIKLALKCEPMIAAKAKANQSLRAGGLTILSTDDDSINTREEIARIAGSSEGTVAKVKNIEAHASEEVKEAVAAGKISVSKAHDLIKEQSPSIAEPAELYDVVVIDIGEIAGKTSTVRNIPCSDDSLVWCYSSSNDLPQTLKALKTSGLTYVATAAILEGALDQEELNCRFVIYAKRGNARLIDTNNFPDCFIEGNGDNLYEFVKNNTDGRRANMSNIEVEGFERLSV